MSAAEQNCEIQRLEGPESKGGKEAVPEILNSLLCVIQRLVYYFRNAIIVQKWWSLNNNDNFDFIVIRRIELS